MPRVSVVITTYNRTTYLEEALQAVLEQTQPVQEVIVVNDGSDEVYREKLDHLTRDPRIRRIDNPSNRGVSYSRNRGIEAATGDYLCFLDDDDTLDPGFVQAMASQLDNQPDLDAVCCRTAVHPQSLEKGAGTRIARLLALRESAYGAMRPTDASYFLLFCPMVHSFLFRKTCFDEVKFPEALAYGEDLTCWLALVRSGVKFGKLDRVLSYVRIHGPSPYAYAVKKQFHRELLQSNLLDAEGRKWQVLRFWSFQLFHGKLPSWKTTAGAMRNPGRLLHFSWLNLRALLG